MMTADEAAPMEGRPTRGRHQTLTIALHWITALLVLTQFALAILHGQVNGSALRSDALAAHRSLGVVIWFLVAGRLLWRVVGMRLLPFPPGVSRWHQRGVRFSEWALYGLLLAQPLTGMAATVLRGRPFHLFGVQVPSLLAPSTAWAATGQGLHTVGAYALAGLVLIHATAAILHRVIANDGVLDSMLPGNDERVGRYAELDVRRDAGLDVHDRWRSLPPGRPPSKRA